MQCACSTSTVAVHLAVQSLLSRESDVALAGGVSFNWLHKGGYHFVEGGILSQDGHTRPFDADASGTVFADGVGLVVLKRLDDAIADGDDIQAIILGTAVNNDGSMKVSYTAPGVDGQSAVFAEALAVAGVSPDAIGYSRGAWHRHGARRSHRGRGAAAGLPDEDRCETVLRLGSLKSNIGHLNTVSGVAGLIKAAMAVKTGEIPPNLNFETPNPKIDFANSPFFVPTKLTKWTGRGPRRAGVSAFGIGGTNTHIIIEEPPPVTSEKTARIDVMSRSFRPRTRRRLRRRVRVLPSIFARIPTKTSPTFATRWRRAVRSIRMRARRLREPQKKPPKRSTPTIPALVVDGQRAAPAQPVTFLFPGQGSQHIFMGRELYNEEPVFRREIDRCAELLKPHLGLDLRDAAVPGGRGGERGRRASAQHAICATGDLRGFLRAGEIVDEPRRAPRRRARPQHRRIRRRLHRRGVLARRRAARRRGAGPPDAEHAGGAMLAVMAPPQQIEPLLPPSISIAAINTPTACVASGPSADIAALEKQFQRRGFPRRRCIRRTPFIRHDGRRGRPFVEVMRRHHS